MKALFRSIALLAIALTALSGCGGDGNMGPTEVNDVNGYLGALPAWSEFSPEKPTEDVPVGDASDLEVFTVGATQYSCTTTPYSITDTPDRLAIFNPDSEIMWLGSLLQGKGHRDGLGSLAELPIRQRAPVQIFTDLLTEANSETVENPDAQSMSRAIGKLIEQAELAGHNAGSKISFDMKQTHSLQQAALFLGVSARYMGTSVEAELSYEQEKEENTLTAYFVQQMFTTSMVLPQTPGDVFSDDFTAQHMQEQVDLGRMGPDNLPTFISNVVWGRMLMMTMTSTHSYEAMEAALRATNDVLEAGGTVEGSHLSVLQESTLKIATIGGNDEGVENLIQTGQLGTYFDAELSLQEARPLSYTVRHLGGDYPIATVSETSQYNLKTCSASNATPTGYVYRLTLDKLEMVEIGCDGAFAPTPEVYYSFSVTNDAGTKTVASRSSGSAVDIPEGGFHTLPYNLNEYNIYKDGRGVIKINGTAWDQDGGSNDDRIGVWTNLTYGASTSNGQRSFTREENGCKIRLYLTMTRVGNLYD